MTRTRTSLRIYIARHGATLWNAEGRRQGRTDTPLSPIGVQQARALAERMADIPLEAVYSSPLTRASETARMIAERHGLTVTLSDDLLEMDLGAWEGKTDAEIVESGQEQLLRRYQTEPDRVRPPGGEPLEHVAERMQRFLKELRGRHLEGSVAVVGHGGSLRALLCEAVRAPALPCMLGFRLENGSLSLIEYRDGRSLLVFANDTCHLRREGTSA